MALSDYLTGDEWDACFYAFLGQHQTSDFGASMRLTIDALLANGYRFSGLDEYGNKVAQVARMTNSRKIKVFFGNLSSDKVIKILDNGRSFLKTHLPNLVDETDEEWEEQKQEG
jgi:hypothetical protein